MYAQCCKCKKRSEWTLSRAVADYQTDLFTTLMTGGRGGGANGKKSGGTPVDARPPCADPIRGWTPSTLKNKWVDAVHLRPPTLAAQASPHFGRQRSPSTLASFFGRERSSAENEDLEFKKSSFLEVHRFAKQYLIWQKRSYY